MGFLRKEQPLVPYKSVLFKWAFDCWCFVFPSGDCSFYVQVDSFHVFLVDWGFSHIGLCGNLFFIFYKLSWAIGKREAYSPLSVHFMSLFTGTKCCLKDFYLKKKLEEITKYLGSYLYIPQGMHDENIILWVLLFMWSTGSNSTVCWCRFLN